MTDQGPARRGRLPLHLEISEMLAREIKAGVLLDGEKLEPERTMAKRLGISVGTLRKALSELNQSGMLERVQGSGNYVRNIEANDTIYGYFRLELLSGGGLPAADTISVKRLKGSSGVNFGKSGEYYRIRRLRYLSEIPAALEEIWLDASYIKKSLIKADLSDSLYQYYKNNLGIWISRVEDTISVASVPGWLPDDFCSGSAGQWGYVERNGWDQHGGHVEFSRTWFDVRSSKYVARWK